MPTMNKHWVFYDQYGWITKSMNCPEEMAQDNVKEGETLVETEQQVNPQNYYVKDATAVQRALFPDISVSESPAVDSTITEHRSNLARRSKNQGDRQLYV